jgi:signal transduction histidine kinase
MKVASGSDKYASNDTAPKPSRRNFYVLPCTIFLILLVGASTVGYFTYSRLSGSEQIHFQATYAAAVNDIESKLQDSFTKKKVASALANSIFTAAIQNGYAGTLPNATLPGFDDIMGNVGILSGLSAISFSPLVTNVTRRRWEEYATINADLLDRPTNYNLPTGESWSVSMGIANCSTHPPSYNTGRVAGSPNPNWLFPFWQVVSKLLLPYESSLMFDPRSSSVETSKAAIDHVILHKSCILTDIITGYRFTLDDLPRPSSVIYSPIIGLGDAKPMVGLLTSQFFWEDIFQPSMLGNVFCVVTTPTHTFTLHLDTKSVKLVGFSDLHDTKYSSFEHIIAPSEVSMISTVPGLSYSVSIFPANSFYVKYVTQMPRNACFLSVCFVVVPVFLFSVYVYLVSRHEEKLISERNASITEAVSRGAVLKAKKVYVRYISHEMRTPLNAAHLGLKILEKNLNYYKGPKQSEHLEIVREVGTACEMAVTILNDLLNYDKLEDETLIIEPTKVVASEYIMQSIPIFARQAQDKGLSIIFDIDQNFYQELGGKKFEREARSANTDQYLHFEDRINVDVHKMNQVIRNVISNAIKFTHQGDSITIRARKKPPMAPEPVPADLPVKKNWFNAPSFKFSEPLYDDLEGNLSARDRNDGPYDDDFGNLVLDVIDTGVGMVPEDSCRLFKEIIQFDPGELQVRILPVPFSCAYVSISSLTYRFAKTQFTFYLTYRLVVVVVLV